LVRQGNSLPIGSILIKNGTSLPNWFRFNYEEYSGCKILIDADAYAVARTAMEAGWHFFCITPPLKCRAFGLTPQSAVRRAVERVMETAQLTSFNSLEIGGIDVRVLLGVYCANLVAHPRHLQATPFLNDPDPYYYPHQVEEFEEIFWRAAEIEPQIKGL
jgi:hypothetical protein